MSLELNKGDQVIFLIDKSGSMSTPDAACGGGTRWAWMQEQIRAFVVGASKFDPDGVSLHFFSTGVNSYANIATIEDANRLLSENHPGGQTNTHLALQAAFNEHVAGGNQPTFVMVFTDGDASDREALAKQIVDITNHITSPEQFRIAFVPVGTLNDDMKTFLDFLDEGLTDAKSDIVSIVPQDKADFLAAIEAAISGTQTEGESGYNAHTAA